MKRILLFLLCASPLYAGEGQGCPVERRAVKTLADPGAHKALASAVESTTVAALAKLSVIDKATLEKQNTRLPEEFRRVQLDVLVVGFKQETDSDYHIVLADPETNQTMIGEIPAPQCVPREYRVEFDKLRRSFVVAFGQVTARYRRLPHPQPAVVEGLVFRDFCHGQTGRAPNCAEIHPIMNMLVHGFGEHPW